MNDSKDTVQNSPNIKRIGFILIDGFSLMSQASAVEPLRAANYLAGKTLYEFTNIPAKGTRAVSSSGAVFEGVPLHENGTDFDLVLVSAAGNPASYSNPELDKYLRNLNSARVRLGGISGGPVILAKAGLMQNRRFTVHWDHYDALLEMNMDLLIERNVYLIDRDRYTCAGGVAPLDMMSAIISAQHGRDLAKQMNDWFIYTSVRGSSEPQRAGLVEKYQVHHPAVLNAIELMQNHLGDPLTSKQLAQLSVIGERQLSRLFQKLLGKKTMEFYRMLRLEHARVLVEQSALSIIEVSVAAGFDSPSYFTICFRKYFGQSPSQMRRQLNRYNQD